MKHAGFMTIWPSLRTPTGTPKELYWDAAFEQFSRRVEFRHDLHPGWSPAVFDDNYRDEEHVQRVFALVMDVDGGWNLGEATKTFKGFYGLIHTTRSHTNEIHRFRIILPLARPVSPFEHAGLWRRLNAKHPGKFDPSCKDSCRFWYTPGVIGGGPFEAIRLDGEPLDPDKLLAEPEPSEAPPVAHKSGSDAETRARAYLAKMPAAISGSGGHAATWAAALALAQGFKLSEASVLSILRSYYNPRCSPPWSEKELRHKARDACNRAKVPAGYVIDVEREPSRQAKQAQSPEPPPDGDNLDDAREDAPPVANDSEAPTPAWQRFGVRRMAETLQAVWQECSRKVKPEYLSTGHGELDKIIGGYRPGRVVVLGAETSWGKSSFAVMAVDVNDLAGKRVLLVSGEDDETTYGKRIAARRTGINAMKLRDGDLSDHEKANLFRTTCAANSNPWFLSGVGIPAEKLAVQILELCKEEKYQLVIVDYVQCFRAKAQDRRNEVSTAARLFCDAIKRGGAAGLILSQIKRLEPGREPTKFDLKESGDIENMAEHVLIGALSSGEHQHTGASENKRFLKVDKNKDGPKCPEALWLPFDEATASFRRTVA